MENSEGTLPKILKKVGLIAKVIITSGETDQELLNKLGGKVLGHKWIPQQTLLSS